MIDIAEGPGRDLKNIRQIGTPAEGDRIYIENAAYARVHEETYEERRVFIFMGHTECEQGVYMTFVEAAIPVRDMEFSQNLPRWGTHACRMYSVRLRDLMRIPLLSDGRWIVKDIHHA